MADTVPASFGFANVVIDGQNVLAAAAGDRVHPLESLLAHAPASFEDLLGSWDDAVTEVAAALGRPAAHRTSYAAGAVDFLAPGVAAPSIWCAGANYADHVAELGFPIDDRPFHFLVPVTAVNRHDGLVRPPANADTLDWEVELAVVVGDTARDIAPDQAMAHIAGYTIANDITVRGRRHPIFGVDWFAAKCADGTTPLGPAIVPRRFVPDPERLELGLTVNGLVRQQASSSLMLVGIAEQLSALSHTVTLRPGDLILTGTPAGTAAAHDHAYLVAGDQVDASIGGLGVLHSEIGPMR